MSAQFKDYYSEKTVGKGGCMNYWTWNSDVLRQWEQTRLRGYWRFVLVRGVVVYGSLWMLICTIIYFYIRPDLPSLHEPPFWIGFILHATVLGPTLGYLLHARLWRRMEKGYEDFKNRVETSSNGGSATRFGNTEAMEDPPPAGGSSG